MTNIELIKQTALIFSWSLVGIAIWFFFLNIIYKFAIAQTVGKNKNEKCT